MARQLMVTTTILLVCGQVLAGQKWKPKSGNGEEAANVRIVEMGIEHQRNGDGHCHAIGSYHRFKIKKQKDGLYRLITARKDAETLHDFDVDGDGDPKNDTVYSHVFSFDPNNPMTPEAPFYDSSIGSQRFYGGATMYQANVQKTIFTEDGMNDFEEGMCFQPRRNWTLFNENYNIFSPYRMYYVAIWPKWDFMNGGNNYRVSFDSKSRFAFLIMRYHMGMEGWRWIVRNGDKFYISEKTFKGAGKNKGDNGGKVHMVYPVREKWAEYHPQGYKIDFDPKTAKFAKRDFDNVTGVGWYMFKDKLISGYVGCKWYAVEADAVVHRPKRPSENIDMAVIEKSKNVPAFYISTCEIPYELWRETHRLKRSNTFVLQKNYTFDKYGDMGSMDLAASRGKDVEFCQDEPVTDLSLYDMLAWCNALSEQESKTPCYYIDPEFKEKFRQVKRSMIYLKEFKLPEIYVNWKADGYRLPTVSEWNQAFVGQNSKINPAEKTMPVDSGKPNSKGLYNMLGNVWEPVWSYGDSLDPASSPEILLLGGDFTGKKPGTVSASPWGDLPYDGSWNIGFRLVRRKKGEKAPAKGPLAENIPSWNLSSGFRSTVDASRQWNAPCKEPVTIKLLDIPGKKYALGTREITFIQWKQVYNWAVNHGFSFDHEGEMGSMAYWGWGKEWKPAAHSTAEPVTGITHYDVMVWLNALSELHGKTPVYYADKNCTKVYQKSYEYRPLMMLLGPRQELRNKKIIGYGWDEQDKTFVKKDANGYRLPSIKEHRHAAFMGKKKLDWSGSVPEIAKHSWCLETSKLRTHKGGLLQANKYGLYDMLGNVAEWSNDFHIGKNKGALAERMGGGFFDLGIRYQGKTHCNYNTARGLMYPDLGFRVLENK